jgi:hypothetical protein
LGRKEEADALRLLKRLQGVLNQVIRANVDVEEFSVMSRVSFKYAAAGGANWLPDGYGCGVNSRQALAL